jgi:transcriptional regulator with XRE-family HTH domain
MDPQHLPRHLTTPQARVAYVLKDAKERKGLSMEAIAAQIGVKHATLSLWTSKTDLLRAKIDVVLRFCELTGFHYRWLLYNEVPPSSRVDALTRKLAELEENDPAALDMVGRMIDAAVPRQSKQ